MHDGESISDQQGRVFTCLKCGGDLAFDISSQHLKCKSCQSIQDMNSSPRDVSENDYADMLAKISELKIHEANLTEHNEVRCDSCGAGVLFEGTLTSQFCPYCGNGIQRNNIHRGGFRTPVDGVLPFQVEQRVATGKLHDWVRSRWFAPRDFKKTALSEHFQGVYLPFWTFDAATRTEYQGQRGDNRLVTDTVNGKTTTRTVTDWSYRSGKFNRFFDDILINAVNDLPQNRIDALAPWPLLDAVSFSHGFLAGYFARTYELPIDGGFKIARVRMEALLKDDCKNRIGGSHQQITRMKWECDAVTYKLMLLPVWLVAYQHRDKSYRVFINAVTGKTAGDRPYSIVKIAAFTAAIAIAVLIIALIVSR